MRRTEFNEDGIAKRGFPFITHYSSAPASKIRGFFAKGGEYLLTSRRQPTVGLGLMKARDEITEIWSRPAATVILPQLRQ
jgi:hypothetical protein